MKVVVCVKQTPSTTAVFTVENGEATWDDPGGKPNIVNPWDEYAIEEAIRLKEDHGASDAIAISMGDESSSEALKTCLAMGCTEAILVSDAAFLGSDSLGTARILAAAINKVDGVQIAVFGKQAIDGDSGQTVVQVARKLGWTPLTFVSAVKEVGPDSITVERLLDEGKEIVQAPLPVVLGTVKEINEPRYPSFMGIRKASRAEIPQWTAADLDIDGSYGQEASKVDWSQLSTIPPREGEVEIIAGDSTEDKAEKLVEKLFAEKVI